MKERSLARRLWSQEVSSLKLPCIAIKRDGAMSPSLANFSGGSLAAAEPEEPVSPCGQMFCQPNMNCYILCTLGFKNPINLPEFRKTMEETLVKHKRFHIVMKKNVKGTDVWVPTEVDIDAHIFEPSSFSKEDFAAPHFVENYIADLATAPSMSFSQPLWECHVLNGTSGHAAAHMVLRMHHSLGDGTSLMSLLLASTRCVEHPDMLPSIPSKRKKQTGALHTFLLSSLWKNFLIAWNTMIGLAYLFTTVLWLKDSDTKIKGHAGEGMAQKSVMFASINLDDMRLVKEALNGTINDVFMGIVGAGLLWKNTSKLNCLRIRATVLMDSRPSPGLQSPWGNRLGSLIFPIPLKYYSDPLDRLRAVKKTSEHMKASLEGTFTYYSGAFLMSITGPVLPTRIVEQLTLRTTLAVSNVPGPMEPVMFGRNPVVHIYAFTAGAPQSLSVFFQSYAGKASLVALTSRDLIPDPDTLCHYMVDALQEMKRAVVLLRQDSK
ncbi:unnamed protein product [Sphagnum balticum]